MLIIFCFFAANRRKPNKNITIINIIFEPSDSFFVDGTSEALTVELTSTVFLYFLVEETVTLSFCLFDKLISSFFKSGFNFLITSIIVLSL